MEKKTNKAKLEMFFSNFKAKLESKFLRKSVL